MGDWVTLLYSKSWQNIENKPHINLKKDKKKNKKIIHIKLKKIKSNVKKRNFKY